MFDSVAAFDGDSTTTKIFPLPVAFTAVDFLVVDFLAVVVVLALVFVLVVVLPDFAGVFFDVGIVITPV